MARMLPKLSEERIAGIESSAEQQFYRWCRDRLPESFLVLHSVSWVVQEPHGGLRDGEADFVICAEDRGIACVEVKGGRIAFDPETGIWTTTDRAGVTSTLRRSPLDQAKDSKYRLLRLTKEDRRWQHLFPLGGPTFAQGAFFPNITDLTGLIGVNTPAELIGGFNDAGALGTWITRVFDYSEGGNSRPKLGVAGATLMQQMLFPGIDVRPVLASELAEAEEKRIRLTDEQSAVLDVLSRRTRALITGGAGTGKTLLALEKVRRLATAGKRTLLVCYNEPLAEKLQGTLKTFPNASACTLHSLCGKLIRDAKGASGRDLLSEVRHEHPDWDLYDAILPEAAARALEIVDYTVDAVVVDEAQDFRGTFWLPLELILKDSDRGTLYVFFDANQQLYGKELCVPIIDEPYLLSRNCRNARPIHDLAYRYYSGDPILPSSIPGEIKNLEASSLKEGANAITAAVADLLIKQRLAASQIAVLIAGMPRLDYIEALEKCQLPAGYKWRMPGSEPKPKGVAVDTIHRFKGLESDVVFLWGMGNAIEKERLELLYVGLSRAKTVLYVVGNMPERNDDDNLNANRSRLTVA